MNDKYFQIVARFFCPTRYISGFRGVLGAYSAAVIKYDELKSSFLETDQINKEWLIPLLIRYLPTGPPNDHLSQFCLLQTPDLRPHKPSRGVLRHRKGFCLFMPTL